MFKKCYTLITMVAMVIYFFPKFLWNMNIFQIKPIFFFFFIFKASLKKYQEYYFSLLQLKPCKIVEAGGLAQKKKIQPTFSIGKACTKSGTLVFQLWILYLVCLWTMVLCLSLQTRAFVFSNFVITHICWQHYNFH
jgi:hypothetical protein